MKKSILLAALFAALSAAPAMAEGNPYVSGSAAVTIPGDVEYSNDDLTKFKTGEAFNLALGYNFNPVRAEVAVGYQLNAFDQEYIAANNATNNYDLDINGNHLKNFNLKALTAMANCYYDIKTSTDVTPYVMGGMGIANLDSGDGWVNDTGFAWQLGAGVGIKASDKITVDIGYRYLKSDGVKDIDGEDIKWHSQSVLAGIRYDF